MGPRVRLAARRGRQPEALRAFVDAVDPAGRARGAASRQRRLSATPSDLEALDALAEAFLTNAVANRASRIQGRTLLATAARVWPSDRAHGAQARADATHAHVAPLSGAAFRALGLPLKTAQMIVLYGTARGVLSAAVRLGIVGSFEAQQLQSACGPWLDASPRCCAPDWAGRSGPDGTASIDLCRRPRSALLAALSILSRMRNGPMHYLPADHTHPHDLRAGRSWPVRRRRRRSLAATFANARSRSASAGPVGSGKTALLLALCRLLRDDYSLAVVTNDIFTKEDGEFLVRHQALAAERIAAVETGGCPHTAVRDDVSQNLDALGS